MRGAKFSLGFLFVAAATAVVPAALWGVSAVAAQQPASGAPSSSVRPLTPPPPPAQPPPAGSLRLTSPAGTAAPTGTAVPRDGRGNPIIPRSPAADPTMPSPEMRAIIEQGAPRTGQATPPPQPGVPEIRIRARVFARDKTPVAVLEVGGRQLTVRKESEIHIPGTADQPSGVQLKVVELSPTELRLEVLKRNQTISLN